MHHQFHTIITSLSPALAIPQQRSNLSLPYGSHLRVPIVLLFWTHDLVHGQIFRDVYSLVVMVIQEKPEDLVRHFVWML